VSHRFGSLYDKAGDTLAAIARIYGTTVQDIINANPDIDPYY